MGRPWPKGHSGNPEGGRVKGRRFNELYLGIAGGLRRRGQVVRRCNEPCWRLA